MKPKQWFPILHTISDWDCRQKEVTANVSLSQIISNSIYKPEKHFFFKQILNFIYLFIYLFLAVLGLRFVRGLSLVAASGGHSSSRCGDRSSSRCVGLSLSRPLPLRGTGSRRVGSAAVAHGPSCSVACGILPDQGSNPCPLH